MIDDNGLTTPLNLDDRIGEHTIIEQISINPQISETAIKFSKVTVGEDVKQYIQARKVFVKKPNKTIY